MATQPSTVAFLVEQMAGAGAMSSRNMFGEYAIYCDGRLVALVCDDKLFIKPTTAGRAYICRVVEAPPYAGAKPYFLISGEQWDDADWMKELVRLSAAELPPPVLKRKSTRTAPRKHPASSNKR